MSHKCPSCGNQVPLPDAVESLQTEAWLERAWVKESIRGLRLAAMLSHRTDQLRVARPEIDRLRRRVHQLLAPNRKGEPGYYSWLRKFRLKNTPRLKALQAAQATA